MNENYLNRKKIEKNRHIFRFIFAAVIILIECFLFYSIWMEFYNPNLRVSYRFRGNYFVTAIYGILLLLFGNVYGGLKIGYYKPFNLIFSLSMTSVISNIVAYIAVIIPAATLYISPVAAVVYLSLLEIAVIAVITLIANKLFLKMFKPQRLLLLYGNREDETEAKFLMRQDRYNIVNKLKIDDEASEEAYIRADEFTKICQSCNDYDGVIIGDISSELRNDILKYCYSNFIRTYTVPKLTDIILKGSETMHLFDSPIYLNRNHGLSIYQAAVKRISDIVMSLIGLILTSPILLITAIAIKIEDRGPVFFKQKRCTKDGREFDILKFRSMIVDAEKDGISVPATERDPRITKVGSVIRATRIDELPQLINILKGNMSVVGPRPERIEHVKKYSEEIPEFAYRMMVKGGLTGYAQVYGKYNTTAYDKLKLDLMYVQNYSIILDMEIILKTIQIVFTKESTEGFSEQASRKMGQE